MFLRTRASQALSLTIGVLVIFFVFGASLEMLNQYLDSPLYRITVAGLSQVLFMLLPLLWFLRRYGFSRREIVRERHTPKPIAWAYGLMGVVGIQAVNVGWNGAMPKLLPLEWAESWNELIALYDSSLTSLVPDDSFLMIALVLLVLGIIPAVVEEFLFRGVLQSSLERVGNPAKAIVITSVFFALAHAYLPSIPALFLMGLWLGYLAYHTQAMHLPLFLHALNNILAVLTMFYVGAEVTGGVNQEATLTQYALFMLMGIAMLAAGVWGVQKHVRQRNIDINAYLPKELQN